LHARALTSTFPDDIGVSLDPVEVEEKLSLYEKRNLRELMEEAAQVRDLGFGNVLTYSPKVFLPITQLCRDVCHYCTFAKSPKQVSSAYLSLCEMLRIAEAGAAAGCREALFTLGDQPELRYARARNELRELGQRTTLSYLEHAAREVYDRTGLLPHLNPGVMQAGDLASLRRVSVSCGLMLESVSTRLCKKGGPHYGSPDKHPDVRLKTIRDAGLLKIPFTTGILTGIGETRQERIEALLLIRDLHQRYGHVQEVIIQNFCAKENTLMANRESLPLEEHLWTIACARLILGHKMSIQVELVNAGINDWGGISPVTPDHVNPEAPWPAIRYLGEQCDFAGKTLVPRLPIYPGYIKDRVSWVDPKFHTALLQNSDSDGLMRECRWLAGKRDVHVPALGTTGQNGPRKTRTNDGKLASIIERALDGAQLDEDSIVRLFKVRGREFDQVVEAADGLRREMNGEAVTYVVNRNINYTNICFYKCGFCAFSKGTGKEDLRGKPYDLSVDSVVEMAREAWMRGATEVCMQGGIHPRYTGQQYIEICRAINDALPELHIHAFSPLEIFQGSNTLGMPIEKFLLVLVNSGLNSLPGTAAEILDDEIRKVICPDKLTTQQWLSVMQTAHSLGIRSTSTIMFGHVDGPRNWARHLLAIRHLQRQTGGFTEFVPLPFVAEMAPIYRRGRARSGPTFREAILMHAVARLVLHPYITNIQTSWVKMGAEGAAACLQAGANDLGGTLMNESISTAAGANHAQGMTPLDFNLIASSVNRELAQRNTIYEPVSDSISNSVNRGYSSNTKLRQYVLE
jgi:FO synthase